MLSGGLKPYLSELVDIDWNSIKIEFRIIFAKDIKSRGILDEVLTASSPLPIDSSTFAIILIQYRQQKSYRKASLPGCVAKKIPGE